MTARRVVTLGNRRVITLGQYCHAWRVVNSAPDDATYPESLCGWWPATARELRAQFSEGLADRINRAIPRHGCGRKWSHDWQRAAQRDARAINDASGARLRVYASQITTDDWRARFSRVFATRED